MKKVRFETLTNGEEMESLECHSPRPLFGGHPLFETAKDSPEFYSRPLVNLDPVELYERSNSSPYSVASKTTLAYDCENQQRFQPSYDLDLSMLDTGHEPRRYSVCKPLSLKAPVINDVSSIRHENTPIAQPRNNNLLPVLQPKENIENSESYPAKDSSFFIRRDNLQLQDANVVRKRFQGLHLGKENNAFAGKAEIMRNGIPNPFSNIPNKVDDALTLSDEENCSCHHCNIKVKEKMVHYAQQQQHSMKVIPHQHRTPEAYHGISKQCQCTMTCHLHYKQDFTQHPCNYGNNVNTNNSQRICTTTQKPQNAVDKKAWVIEKYEQSKKSECTDMDRPSAVAKEKREPTVGDLFKIIKLQNEQLQMLQEKVDRFISNNANKMETQPLPLQNYVTENVALETVDSNHKISIGVMTSFEMVRTSTVINKDIIMKQANSNAQVQCNRSQISVKEVAFHQPSSQNFLDGILPVGSTQSETTDNLSSNRSNDPTWQCNTVPKPHYMQEEKALNMPEEKTLNECSLYNVQVDNATTPLISPEQTMYLDVRDYSDSDSTSSDQSNVGWTYYNKVMTHVNNVLQDSDMPSSASALFRNTRQQCVQMQIDKTNISVTKRVKFGDELQGVPRTQYQQHLSNAATTDTSMKMNLLAAKYLKMAPQKQQQHPVAKVVAPNDMSFATRKYMERHQILQGLPPATSRSPLLNNDYGGRLDSSPTYEMPKFLDITALKQQPKLL